MPRGTSIRVCHVITGLRTEGPRSCSRSCFPVDRSPLRIPWLSWVIGDRRAAAGPTGVPVEAIGVTQGVVTPGRWRKFRGAIERVEADVLVGWMYHGNRPRRWVPMVAARAGGDGGFAIFGGYARERPGTRLAVWLGARLSTRADRILYNSAASARDHEATRVRPQASGDDPQWIRLGEFLPRARPAGEVLRPNARFPTAPSVVCQVARYLRMKITSDSSMRSARLVEAGLPVHR